MIRYYIKSKDLIAFLKDNELDEYCKINGDTVIAEAPELYEANDSDISQVLYELLCFNRANGDDWDEDDWDCDEDGGFGADFDSDEYLELQEFMGSCKFTYEWEEIISGEIDTGFYFGSEISRYDSKDKRIYYLALKEEIQYSDDIEYNPKAKKPLQKYSGADDYTPFMCVDKGVLVYLSDENENIKALSDNSFVRSALKLPSCCKVIDSNCREYSDVLPSLEELNFTECVEKIGPYAFTHLTELKTIKLGPQIKFIGFGAFYKCNPDTIELAPNLNYSREYLLGIGDIPEEYECDKLFDQEKSFKQAKRWD